MNGLTINTMKEDSNTKTKKSMFGRLKRKAKPFSTKERQEMWKDLKRKAELEELDHIRCKNLNG